MNKRAPCLRESFLSALCGIRDAWINERNMKIHAAATIIAVLSGFWLRLERMEWLFLISAVFLVLTMEMLNTSLERVVDLFTLDYHPMARLAKDAAAGSALLASLYAVVVAVMLIWPRLSSGVNIF